MKNTWTKNNLHGRNCSREDDKLPKVLWWNTVLLIALVCGCWRAQCRRGPLVPFMFSGWTLRGRQLFWKFDPVCYETTARECAVKQLFRALAFSERALM